MRTRFAVAVAGVIVVLATSVFGDQSFVGPLASYTDAIGDIDAGISTGGGTLDIVGMEVSNTATDINFKLTVNGNVSTTDWGKFMIGIGSSNAPLGTTTGNGWNRPINLQYTPDAFPTPAGMDYWIGSWVDSGGGSEFYAWNGAAWTGPTAITSFSFTPGATSDINYTVSLASLGLVAGDQFTFDAYSSGGSTTDTAIDALANPNVAVTTWAGPYTSKPVTFGGGGLNSYIVPEPSSCASLIAGLACGGYSLFRRRRAR